MPNKLPRLGKLPPKHTFFLNPYQDDRFTRCPECDRPMKNRKNPLLIGVGTSVVMIFNIKGNFCPGCDLLIVHRDILDSYLITALFQRNPELSGALLMIFGTVERNTWRASQKRAVGWDEIIANLRDFKEIVDYHFD